MHGGFGRSYLCKLSQNVSCCTSENMVFKHGEIDDAGGIGLGTLTFSFSLQLLNPLKKPALDIAECVASL